MTGMRNLSLIFLVLIIFSACSQMPSNESTQKPAGGMGAPPPPSEDFGVSCFVEFGDSIAAGAPSFHTFHTTDGGLTWEELPDSTPLGGSDCSSRKGSWELWASPGGAVRYQFNPGQNIQLSEDSGANWQNILDLAGIDWQPPNTPEPGRDAVVQPGPLDAMIDPASGNLLLAMGHAGVLLRLPSGEWQWVDAGRYYHGDLAEIRANAARLKVQQSGSPMEIILLPPDTVIKAHENYTTSLLFSPGGETLASSGYDGGIKLFGFPAGDLQRWQQWGKDRRDSTLYGAAFSPDGSTLVTCGTNVDKTLHFWDISNWKLIKKYEGFQTGMLNSTTFSGQQYLAIAYGEDPNLKDQIKIFDMPTGELKATLTTQLGEITSLKYIPGSSLIMVGSFSGGVELWDSASGEKVFTMRPNQPPDDRAAGYRKVYSTGYHPAREAVMAVFGDGSLMSWNASTGEPAGSLSLPAPHGGIVSSAAFSADGRLVALGFQNGPLMLFDNLDGRAVAKQWTSDNGTLMELAFSPDSLWLAAGYASGDVKIWQVNRLAK